MSNLNNIVVMLGGGSAERAISIKSGNAILTALNGAGYKAIAFDPFYESVWSLKDIGCDLVFIALHGGDGENGKIQAALDLMNIPYTGSGVQASAMAMDKWCTKVIWQSCGLPTPPGELISEATCFEQVEARLGLPLFMKPTIEGSSIGVVKVECGGSLKSAWNQSSYKNLPMMVEKAIVGGEYTVAIVGEDIFPIVKVVPANGFYDYDAKYLRNDTQYLCPSDLTNALEVRIRKEAMVAFKALGCRGWGRVDFLMDNCGQHYFLEINTSPGMTDHSLVPMAAAAANISFSELVLKVVSSVNR